MNKENSHDLVALPKNTPETWLHQWVLEPKIHGAQKEGNKEWYLKLHLKVAQLGTPTQEGAQKAYVQCFRSALLYFFYNAPAKARRTQ